MKAFDDVDDDMITIPWPLRAVPGHGILYYCGFLGDPSSRDENAMTLDVNFPDQI